MADFVAARDVAAPGLPHAACATYLPHLRAAIRVFGGDAVRVVHNDAIREGDMARVAAFLSLPPLAPRPAYPTRPVPDGEFSPSERDHWDASWLATLEFLRLSGVAVLEPVAGVVAATPAAGGGALGALSSE